MTILPERAVEQQIGELDYQFKQGARQMDTILDLGTPTPRDADAP